MPNDLILPVPPVVSSAYLVPAFLPAGTARQWATAAISRQARGSTLYEAIEHVLSSDLVTFSSEPSAAFPPLPVDLQRQLGAEPDQIQVVTGAADLVVVRGVYAPGWPPLHEFAARAAAAVLAADLDVPLVDTFVPQILSAATATAALPDGSRFRLADWVLVFQSAGDTGVSSSTKGLARFGLPELRIRNAPAQLALPLVHVLTALASRLLGLWHRALPGGDRPAFAELPAELEVSLADLHRAHGAEPHGDSYRAKVLLRHEPRANVRTATFLTVQPPGDFAASAGEHLAAVCAALFGPAMSEVQWLSAADDPAQATQAMLDSLPVVRARLLAGELPPQVTLMVKYRASERGASEYAWAYVTSWQDPATAIGYAYDRATSDQPVRSGRPVAVPAGAIIDWAVWSDGNRRVAGGAASESARPWAGQDQGDDHRTS